MTAVLLLSCSDQKGLVASISNFISDIGGNIINLAEHVDSEEKMFFIRVEWKMDEVHYSYDELILKFRPLAEKINAKWRIELAEKKHKIAIFVSKYDHVLQEILWRHKLGEFNTEICSIISNHNDLEILAKNYNIPFQHFPINNQNKLEQEQNEIDLLKKLDVDIIVLARYMQILSTKFVSEFPNKIINIHPALLPKFGGKGMHGMHVHHSVIEAKETESGISIHYVNAKYDEGNIIFQAKCSILPNDTPEILANKIHQLEQQHFPKIIEQVVAKLK